MLILKDKQIEIDFFPHSDFFLEWPKSAEESISAESDKGRIRVKYSGVPDLVYILSAKTGTDFLPEKIKDGARRKDFISFSDENYKRFYDRKSDKLGFFKKLWELLGNDEQKNDRLKAFYEELSYLKKLIPDSEYIGFIPQTAEYSSVNILYQDFIYLQQRKNILKLDLILAREIVRLSLEHYGSVISPALRPLLER